jgi:hypothetical protein
VCERVLCRVCPRAFRVWRQIAQLVCVEGDLLNAGELCPKPLDAKWPGASPSQGVPGKWGLEGCCVGFAPARFAFGGKSHNSFALRGTYSMQASCAICLSTRNGRGRARHRGPRKMGSGGVLCRVRPRAVCVWRQIAQLVCVEGHLLNAGELCPKPLDAKWPGASPSQAPRRRSQENGVWRGAVSGSPPRGLRLAANRTTRLR